MENIKILVIDDDKKLCRLIQDYLAPMGYDVSSAYTGDDGLKAALSGAYHVVILDVMLPGLDGFEVLKGIRRRSDLPVLMLTSRGDETDRIVGLEMGADDYLPKTFSTRELLARLRAVTRRYFKTADQPEPAGNEGEKPIRVGGLLIEPGPHRATLNGAFLELTPLEYQLLLCLARSAGRVLTRDHLLDDISGRDYDVFDRSVDVHISSLRRKLGDDPKNPHFIKTVRSVGYMLIKE